jgi:primosomal protein N' (replication factor Y)
VTDRTDQLSLLRAQVRPVRATATQDPAPVNPVAEVLPDVGLSHLDRTFDYLVPAKLADRVVAGTRVRVRFAGRDLLGYVVARKPVSDHPGQLAPIRRSVSAEPVLTPAIARLCHQVAGRYAGLTSDVVRLAVPPRHARTESAEHSPPADAWTAPSRPNDHGWSVVVGGEAFLRRIASADAPRAAWTALGTDDWTQMFATAACAALDGGLGAVLLVPDGHDVDRLDAAVIETLGPGHHVVLTAELGPAARYRAFLACLRGDIPIVVGTRAAAFAPIRNLGLLAMWDDGDDSYAEQRAPYPHAREVLRMRSEIEGTALLLAGHAMSTDTAALVQSGWVQAISGSREDRRATSPRVHVTGESDAELQRDPAARVARVPRRVFEVVRDALTRGPVLIHTPRQGYLPSLTCADCGHRARCAHCSGPLEGNAGSGPPGCRWCARAADGWVCSHCSATRFRAPVVGAIRTVEEWGRSFPSTSVLSSTAERRIEVVQAEPALVIATPGAEQRASGGYAAAVLLDTWLTLSRPSLRAAEEAMRRWANIVALVRPADVGGRVIAVGDASSPVLQALVRSDPVGFATRDLAERMEARLPPAAYVATVTAAAEVLEEMREQWTLPASATVLGPVTMSPAGSDETKPGSSSTAPEQRIVVSVPRTEGAALARALIELQSVRSARKAPAVRVHVDPVDL